MSKGDLFIVDDNPNNLGLLAGILRIAGKRIWQHNHILKFALVQQDHILPIAAVIHRHGQRAHALVGQLARH